MSSPPYRSKRAIGYDISNIIHSDIKYRLVEIGPYRSPYSPYTYLTPGSLYTNRLYRCPPVGVFNSDETALGGLWDNFFTTYGWETPLLYTGQSLEQVATNKTGFSYNLDRFLVFLCSTKKILVARENIRELKRFVKTK